MGSVTEATILHHFCIVLLFLWFLNSFGYCHPVAYFLCLIYIYLVHEGYVLKLRKKLQFEEKRDSNQRRVLSESETVRWLNYAVEKIWLVCVEEIVSQKILLPIFPWFLKKYKPWTVKDVEVQHLYLGRSPPIITEMRVAHQSSGDDHLVLELGMNFRTADDMSAILGVKLRKRLGFGMLAKMHLLGLHIEGKVLVGVKFLRGWPFISRMRVCFAEPPYFQMTAKPIFSHGLDVTELPGIAGWIDNLLAHVFEETLVEPNMLVVDVEKFASPQSENWFSVDAKEPIAHAIVEVLEAAEMNPSDLNGLADPYVKGRLGPYRFRTKTHKKTLSPKWREEFKIPICSWESDNLLVIQALDKDRLYDDTMGDCIVNINELRDGQRHDLWLPLQNIKMGRLHLAVTVLSEGIGKVAEAPRNTEVPDIDLKKIPITDDSPQQDPLPLTPKSSEKSPKLLDNFEPIDVEGQSDTGIWIHHPGSEVAQVWEPRKGKSRNQKNRQQLNTQIQNDGSSSSDESMDSAKSSSKVRRGLRKIGSVFHRSPKEEDNKSGPLGGEAEQSLRDNIKALNGKEGGVKWISDDTVIPTSPKMLGKEMEENGAENQHLHSKDVAKSILKQAGKSARILKSAFSRKVSRKSMDKDSSLEQESLDDDEESIRSAVTEESGLEIPSSDVSIPASSVLDNNSFKLEDSDVQTSLTDENGLEIPASSVPDDNSFKLEESVVQTATPSGNDRIEAADFKVPTGDVSFSHVEGTDMIPK